MEKKSLTKKQLFNLLTLVGGVRVSQWKMVRIIVKYLNDNPEIVETAKSEWVDYVKKITDAKLDLTKIDTWSTHEGCIIFDFKTLAARRISCKAIVWDGDNMDGHRTGIRFKAEFILPANFIEELRDNIGWEFDRFLEDAYETHLKVQKANYINTLREETLVLNS